MPNNLLTTQTPSSRCDKCPAVFMLEVFYQLHKKKHLESESVMIPRDPHHQQHHHQHHHPPHDSAKSSVSPPKKPQKRFKTKKAVKYVKGLHCLRCQISVGSFDELVSHMTKHTGSTKGPSQCGNCDYQTLNRGNFKRHLMTHGNVRPYKCVLCPFWARQKTHLAKHLRYHGGDREFKCGDCDYSCSDKANFNRHKNWHPATCSRLQEDSSNSPTGSNVNLIQVPQSLSHEKHDSNILMTEADVAMAADIAKIFKTGNGSMQKRR